MSLLLLVTVSVLSLIVGCSGTPKPSPSTGKPLNSTDEQIFVGDTVEKNYDPNVIMKRAESFFEKEDYPEAIIEYQHFLDLHAIHVLAPYAQYKLAESHFKMVKSIDRDPDPIRKAKEAFERLLRSFPGSKYETEATARIRVCQDWMAQVHLFIGQFYYRRESYLAAAHRFAAILEEFPEMDAVADALYYLALTYNELGADDWAHEKLVALAERFPNKYTKESKRLFAQLNLKRPADAVAVAKAQPPTADAPSRSAGGRVRLFGQPTVNAAIASLQNSPNGSLATKTTLCRLGAWC